MQTNTYYLEPIGIIKLLAILYWIQLLIKLKYLKQIMSQSKQNWIGNYTITRSRNENYALYNLETFVNLTL